jgi:hypothetical protein
MTGDHNNWNFWFYFLLLQAIPPSIFGILCRTKQDRNRYFLFFHNPAHRLQHLQLVGITLLRKYFESTLRIAASSSMINILLISILIIRNLFLSSD